jgi:hypothetical protein
MAPVASSLFACFGYGSLVNRQTLRSADIVCHPARLGGWRRHWQSRGAAIEPADGDEIALLSVHSDDTCEIDGMLILDEVKNLIALDRREQRYRRVRIERAQLGFPAGKPDFDLPGDLFVYVGLPEPNPEKPAFLLQSYLDAVLAGFLREHGETGLDRFFASTRGFARPMIADRNMPRYPRAVGLAPEMAAEFDRRLAEVGVETRPAISA